MTRDQDLISKGMLVRWNEEWKGRELGATTPLYVEDDGEIGLSDEEDVVQVKMEVK